MLRPFLLTAKSLQLGLCGTPQIITNGNPMFLIVCTFRPRTVRPYRTFLKRLIITVLLLHKVSVFSLLYARQCRINI